MENKINIARFKEGSRTVEVKDIWQWDYGQILRIQGLNLPTAVEIHFSLDEQGGEALRRIGVTKDGVTDVPIPDSMVENESAYGDSYYFFAYIYLTDETSGNTEYKIRARVSTRSKPEGYVSGGNDTFAEILKTVNEIAEDKVDIPVPAKVGQVLAVKATDESGKPTEFEAKDMSGGVSDEKIAEAVGTYMEANPIEESDPTVSEWAKQPEKPSYTALEVGALPAGTKIPSKTSDLQNDSGFTTLMLDDLLTDNTKAAPAGMVGELRSDLADLFKIDLPSLFHRGYISADGHIYDNAGNNSSYYSDIISNNRICNGLIRVAEGYGINFAYYSNGVFTNRGSWAYNHDYNYTNNGYDVRIIIGTESASDKTILDMLNAYNFSIVLPTLDTVSNELDTVKSDVYGTEYVATFTDGNISASGVVSDVPTEKGNCKSNLITSDKFDYIEIIADDSKYYTGYCKYKNGTFVSRVAWNTTHRIDNDGHDVIILFSSITSGKTKEDVLSECSINVVRNTINFRIEELEKKDDGKKIKYISKVLCSDTGRNIVHFSVDDTWICIKDITDNQYASVFENSFLGALKNLHDTYGICVTLNTFNTISTDSSYSISNVPTSYQEEFQANKSWLKFAFHAESDVENYNTSIGISTSYDTFVNAIYNLTGDYDCIDRVTRLGYFGGTLENVLAIKNKEHGIIGLLCADDTRISYYLTEEQNNIVQKKGKYIDAEHEIFMIKTITRNLDDAVSEINGNLCYQKFVEIFMHEYEGNPTFKTVAEWSKNNGYVSAFPSLLLN